jgi:hypothetical protein
MMAALADRGAIILGAFAYRSCFTPLRVCIDSFATSQ